jgi:Uncharacterized protein conserved in bacteria
MEPSGARRAQFTDWLAKRHGVAHSSDARARGFTDREIAGAVRDGAARRVRRSWLVAPDCDARRAAAASVSGRVTCVSTAAIHGLVVPEHSDVHVAVAGNASRFEREGIVLHWARGPAPVGRNSIDDPIINVLFHAARCLPRADALALWESAIRKKKTDAVLLSRIAWRSTRASEIARVAQDLSDSALETRFFDEARAAGIGIRRQVRIDGHRVDGVVGETLIVQLDGFAFHSAAAARRRDLEADARLLLRGYTVLRFDFQQVFFQWDAVLETILMAIAQGLHRREIR